MRNELDLKISLVLRSALNNSSVVKKEMTPFEIGIIFGAMAGWAAFFYLIYKSKMDKPKLEFETESQFFFPPSSTNENFTAITVRMKAHNKGSKSTTIHHSALTFNYEGKQHKVEDKVNHNVIPPNSTVDFWPQLNLHREELLINEKIIDCVLTIDHTFGQEIISLGKIEEHKK